MESYMKALFSLFICFSNVFCYAQFAGGNGTYNSPYLISTAEQLSYVADNVNKYYKQTCDIDLTNYIIENSTKGWFPIGSNYDPFTGSYDGGGYTIKGLSINRPTTDNVGLFGYVKNGTIRNLKIETADITGKNYSSTIVGYALTAKIDNIIISGSIKGADYCAGAIGYSQNSTISNVQFSGNIEGTNYIGGIIGVLNCHNEITSPGGFSNESGIWISRKTVSYSLNNCNSNCLIRGVNHIGGIIGQLSCDNFNQNQKRNGNSGSYKLEGNVNCAITNSDFEGEIYGKENIGGIIGNIYINSKSVSEGFDGNVHQVYPSDQYIHVTLHAYTTSNTNLSLQRCSNIGIISAESNTGGIVGAVHSTSENNINGVYPNLASSFCYPSYNISNCTNNGNITSINDNAGGIIGYSDLQTSLPISNESSVANCLTSAEYIRANNNAGGIVGYDYEGNVSIINSLALGNIKAQKSYAGGIIGQGKNTSVQYCVCALMSVSAKDNSNRIGIAKSLISNKALLETKVYCNNSEIDPEINTQTNGASISLENLYKGNTYHSMGWDLSRIWKIKEEENYPYLRNQTAPLVDNIMVQKINNNLTTITGKVSYSNGLIYAQENNVLYKGEIEEGSNWKINVLKDVHIGDTIQIIGKDSQNSPSYSLFKIIDSFQSPVGKVQIDANNPHISVNGNKIEITEIDDKTFIEVYSISGIPLYSGVYKAVIVPCTGFYLVKIARKTYKILVD